MLPHGARLRFEVHNGRVEDAYTGSLVMSRGRSWGSLVFPSDAEVQLRDIAREDAPWQRAYLHTPEEVLAAWARDPQSGGVQYLARSGDYSTSWSLPFVATEDARIARAVLHEDVSTAEEARAWAANELRSAITAVLMFGGVVFRAWELVDGQLQLVSRRLSVPN